MRDRHVLVIADNVEQVIDAGADLAHLVAHCPELTLLATSREPLRITGETEYPIAPLQLPDVGRDLDPERLRENPAVSLFVQRASAVRPGFDLTPENAATIVAICQRLDGLPLAVELAAARVRSLPVAQLRERLEQPLRFLTGGARDLPARQQAMRDTIQWSYDLLTPDEQRLFRRLAVFVGGWTLEISEAVVDINGDLALDTLDILLSLVEKSLVVQHESADGAPRYRLLVPIREFASEQLDQHGDTETLRQRHAEAMRDFARESDRFLVGYEPGWVTRVDIEHENIRSALTWASDTGADVLGIEVVGRLRYAWFVRGRLRDGLEWTRAFLSRYPVADAARARALLGLSMCKREGGGFEVAGQAAEEALVIGRALDDVALMAEAMLLRAAAIMYLPDPDDAVVESTLSEALDLAGANVLESLTANILNFRSIHDILANRYDRAEDSLQRAREIAARLNLIGSHAAACWLLGWVTALRGDDNEALTHTREVLLANRNTVNELATLLALELVGSVLARNGQAMLAIQLRALVDRERRIMGLVAPVYWAKYVRVVYEAHGRLDPATFDDAWRAGAAMSVADGVAMALEQTLADQPSASTSTRLTPRELDVLRLVATGLTDAEVAERLFLSRRTVSSHLTSIYTKLGVSSRAAATRYAVDHELA
ncbi:MAG TPA: LuxR C-terminal-related transcriptional regulator [Thermomicrobiales bacterium]|nr:LuxR C-terminal-related transcriptional regulator [Thermomicrobiales bacterium]